MDARELADLIGRAMSRALRRIPAGMENNYGNVKPFPSVQQAGGNFSVTQNVQLISARPVEPMPWVVTLQPVTRSDFQGVVPWQTTFPSGSLGLTPITPNVPQNVIDGYQVNLVWGAGAVRGSAVFDYPMAGGVFGIVADTLDLNVMAPGGGTTLFAAAGLIPVFGAFMVPGASSRGVRRTDSAQDANAPIGTSYQWTVKPYARAVWVSTFIGDTPGQRYRVDFLNSVGAILWSTEQATGAGSLNSGPEPFPVPPQATTLRLTNISIAAPGALWSVMWDMAFC